MAFLYIGTCQARSESSHPNDAQRKLLSWVSPTPDQSFMTRSVTDAPGDLVLLTANPAGSVAPGDEVTLTLSANGAVPAEILAALSLMGYSTPEAAFDAATITWEVNDGALSSLVVPVAGNKLQGKFSSTTLGTYHVKAFVSFGSRSFESNTIDVEVADATTPAGVLFVNIMGNTQVCSDDHVTLSACVTGDASTVTR